MGKKINTFSLDEKNVYHFWLDHLEVYGTFREEYRFEGLDFENSNYIEYEDYILTKHEVPKYAYKILFTKESFPVFAYYKGKISEQGVSTKDYFCVYATAFRLFGMWEIYQLLYVYIEPKSPRRFDICIDMLAPIEQVLATFGEIHQKSAVFRGSKGETETLYIWEKQTTKNKRQIIRVYNKILDILKKGKHTLYSDYLLKSEITRIELEVRSELAKNATLEQVFDSRYLVSLLKNYMQKHTPIFDEVNQEPISLYKKRDKIDLEDIQYRSGIAEQRVKIFMGHARSLFQIGYCPTELLLEEWLLQERTKIGLWYENIATYIHRIKVNRHWYKNIFPLFQ